MNRLQAISPVDGRYGQRIAELVPFFSEYGLMRYRVVTEVEYFIALSSAGLPQFQGFPAGRPRLCEKFILDSVKLTLRQLRIQRR